MLYSCTINGGKQQLKTPYRNLLNNNIQKTPTVINTIVILIHTHLQEYYIIMEHHNSLTIILNNEIKHYI